MSRSGPPRSNIAARVRASSVATGREARAGRPRRRLGIRFAALMRWLHIYLSMFGLAAVLFFGVTGLTLNHPGWFYGEAEHRAQAEGRVEPRWLAAGSAEGQVDKLSVVEHLRAKHGVRGALAEFRVDEAECLVTFKGPGYAADAFIDREDGRYELTVTSHGLVAVINDLHKGRDTGPAWSVVIDVSAVLMALIGLTGLALIFYLKLRRRPGLVVALAGAAVLGLVVWLWVPA
jgi:uncharacterized protein